MQATRDAIAIPPGTVVEAIAQHASVEAGDIAVRPTAQDWSPEPRDLSPGAGWAQFDVREGTFRPLLGLRYRSCIR